MRKWLSIGKPRYTQYERIPERVYVHYRANLSRVHPSKITPKVRSIAFKDAWIKYGREQR